MNKKILMLAAAIAAIYLLNQKKKPNDFVNEIFYGTPNGWRYFDNGGSISPDGKYYKADQLIWSPT